MEKSRKKKIFDLFLLSMFVICLAMGMALLTLYLIVPDEHTIEYELTFDNAQLQRTYIAIDVEQYPEYYKEETYEEMKNATPSNNTIYVYTIEGSFESEGVYGGHEEEIYNQVYLFYYSESDELIHYLKYEARSRYEMTIDMNTSYIKITFEGANI